MTALSVNINKFALVRNARGSNMPDIMNISEKCLKYGADGITLHPRPDERHAKFSDLTPLQNLVSKYEKKEFNIDSERLAQLSTEFSNNFLDATKEWSLFQMLPVFLASSTSSMSVPKFSFILRC